MIRPQLTVSPNACKLIRNKKKKKVKKVKKEKKEIKMNK